ncbi:dihydrodipicolinate reductase [Candidatus Woesearchaeota archaeon]|nr:dihydrodipicolinate reductase [Candidatus Woesearchaeota archaeon]
MKVMVNGLPGKMASVVIGRIIYDDYSRFELLNHSFSSQARKGEFLNLFGTNICLHGNPSDELLMSWGDNSFFTVDYTRPDAVNANADFYCRNKLPFVMGTTGGDRIALEQRVSDSDTVAVIAPNMAKQVVAFQAMMKYGAETFPDVFAGYTLEIVESHQKGKADTSGTARAMVEYFNRLGIPFTKEQIVMVRDPEVQEQVLGVPREHLAGHGWHTYRLTSRDEDGGNRVLFQFTHNLNGRRPYAEPTLDALTFLEKKVVAGEKGKVYSMIDVLKG